MRISLAALDQATAQANPCACQYLLPGVTPIPNLPTCDPTTGTAPNCSAAEGAAPFCAGIPYGQPGYEECIEQAEATTTVGAVGPPTPVNPAPYQAIIASLPVPAPAPSSPTPAPSTPPPAAQPSPGAAGSGVTQQQISSAATSAPVNVSGTAAVAASPSPFAFLTDTAIDGIPNWALLVAAGLGLMLIFGGKR